MIGYETRILPYRSLRQQHPWFTLECCISLFVKSLSELRLWPRKECTCDIGFQLIKAGFLLWRFGTAWVSKVTDRAAKKIFPGAKKYLEVGPSHISLTFGWFSRCHMNRDPRRAVHLNFSTNLKFVIRSQWLIFIKCDNSNREGKQLQLLRLSHFSFSIPPPSCCLSAYEIFIQL